MRNTPSSETADMVKCLLTFFGIAVAIIYAVYSRSRERKRTQALRCVADYLHLGFSSDKDYNMGQTFNEHKLFQQGHGCYAYNSMSGAHNNYPLYSFDYHYTTGSGKNRVEHYFSCVLLDTNMRLKSLFIHHEGLLGRIIDDIVFSRIHFESDEFNRKFCVKSESEKFAYDIIHPRMIELLLQKYSCLANFTIDFSGHSILLFKEGVRKPEEVEPTIKTLKDIVDLIPAYLIEELKAE